LAEIQGGKIGSYIKWEDMGRDSTLRAAYIVAESPRSDTAGDLSVRGASTYWMQE